MRRRRDNRIHQLLTEEVLQQTQAHIHIMSPPPMQLGSPDKIRKMLLNTYTRFPPENAHRQQRPNCLQQTHQRSNCLQQTHQRPNCLQWTHQRPNCLQWTHQRSNCLQQTHQRPNCLQQTHQRSNCLQQTQLRHDLPTTHTAET